MRHAKSDWNTGVSKDFDRPLNERGKKDAPRMGKWLKNNQYIPERFLSSPARRTLQTSHSLVEAMGMRKKDIIEVANIYEASLDDLCTVIDQYSDGVNSLLIVGHNPGLEELAYHLSKDKLPLTDNGKFLTTAAAVVLNYGKHPISSESSTAKLESVMRPRELG